MNEIREQLLRRDYLYGDASAYRAGVEAALAAIATTSTPADTDVDSTQNIAMAVAVGHA